MWIINLVFIVLISVATSINFYLDSKQDDDIALVKSPDYNRQIVVPHPANPNEDLTYIHYGFVPADNENTFYMPIYVTANSMVQLFTERMIQQLEEQRDAVNEA